MAEIWGAVIGGIGAIGGGILGSKGAKDAAKEQNKLSREALAEQQRQFDIFQQNIAPYLGYGQSNIAALNKLLAGDYSGFEDSPDYVYTRDQMQQGIERGAAAQGRLFSGGTNVDLAGALNGLASQNLGNYRNFLMGGAQMGQNAAVGAGSIGQQNANSVGNILSNIGQANANASMNSTNAWLNALNGVTSAAAGWAGARNNQTTTTNPYDMNYSAFMPNQTGFGGSNQNWLAGYGTGGGTLRGSW